MGASNRIKSSWVQCVLLLTTFLLTYDFIAYSFVFEEMIGSFPVQIYDERMRNHSRNYRIRIFISSTCNRCRLLICLVTVFTVLVVLQSGIPKSAFHIAQNSGRQRQFEISDIHVDTTMKERKRQVEDTCARNGKISGNTTMVSGIRSKQFSYCVVPKAGCTMWIRLFQFVSEQDTDSQNPMALSKYMVHIIGNMSDILISPEETYKTFIKNGTRSMTVRHPYTRLWSAYIDKFLLPDFWFTRGISIVLSRPSPEPLATRCGHDVTFPELINQVIKTGHNMSYIDQDRHWLPASDICDPCVFKPDIIGKQETFMQDFAFTLKRIGLQDILTKFLAVDHTEYEIKDEIDYNFQKYEEIASCIDKYELGKRLWTAFTLNGYLPQDETFPTNTTIGSLNATSFYSLVSKVRRKYKVTNAQVLARRKQTLFTAFKQIPKTHKEELKKLYKHDFELFGYESDPEFFQENDKINDQQ